MEIFLPNGVSKQDMQRYKDSLAYSVAERPIHGKLNAYYTTTSTVVYTPSPGYSGTDMFTYRMVVGAITSALATVAITVGEGNYQVVTEPPPGRFAFGKNRHDERKQLPQDDADGNDTDTDLERGSVRGGRNKARQNRGSNNEQDIEINSVSDTQHTRPPMKSPTSRRGRDSGDSTMPDVPGSPTNASYRTPFMNTLMKGSSARNVPPPPNDI